MFMPLIVLNVREVRETETRLIVSSPEQVQEQNTVVNMAKDETILKSLFELCNNKINK